ncbi:MAG: ATPase domain-containing protein [Halobacteriales archaeon]|nr:ATPase domain-containing protein [Halobacteriales archaeon]
MAVSTGSRVLDRMLEGGFPEQRSILVTGGPGVGKSTFGMQFLQAGLDEDEDCLYVTTEQTAEEIVTSFDNFAFDLEDRKLTVASIHARAGKTLETGEEQLTLQTLEGNEMLGGGYSAPFQPQYVEEYLERFGPCDRVVFDSVSGLNVMSEDPYHFRRAVLDLIRMFTDEFGATSLFTAEGVDMDDGARTTPTMTADKVIEFATHGVIALRRERVRGRLRRFLQVVKMRGIDHDNREYEVGINEDGIFLSPEREGVATPSFGEEAVSTGLEKLDALCGGGLLRGHPVLMKHDGRAVVDQLVASIAGSALDEGMGLWFVPSPSMVPDRFEEMLPTDEWSVQSLLDNNRIFVLDAFSGWDQYRDHRNVWSVQSGGWLYNILMRSDLLTMSFVKRSIRHIDKRRDGPLLAPIYTEALLRLFSPSQIRELYYWARDEITVPGDTPFYIQNPETMEKRLSEFFVYDAQQVLDTWKHERGIQYLYLEKSPMGSPDTVGIVDQINEPPFVTVSRTV